MSMDGSDERNQHLAGIRPRWAIGSEPLDTHHGRRPAHYFWHVSRVSLPDAAERFWPTCTVASISGAITIAGVVRAWTDHW
jgi:hypothetical protein